MSDETQSRDAISMMLAKLILVMMGFGVLLLVLVVVGYLGNKYYASEEQAKELDLIKQEAFTRNQSTAEYLAAELRADRLSKVKFDGFIATLAAENTGGEDMGRDYVQIVEEEEESAMPTSPFELAKKKMLPLPELAVTDTDILMMSGKAALIHTTVGTIVVELYPERAPITCKNFLYLVANGFYDGLYFHRNQPGAYIQAGSPTGLRGDTPGYSFSMEYNGITPLIGMIAALPSPNGPEVGSEFVLFTAHAAVYEGQVSVFGRVIDRFDVAEKIADTRFDRNGYSFDRTYIRTIEIVNTDSVRPEEDFWENYGKE